MTIFYSTHLFSSIPVTNISKKDRITMPTEDSLVLNFNAILVDAAHSFEKIRTTVKSPREYDTTIYNVNQGIFNNEYGHIVRYEANYSFILKENFPDEYYYVDYITMGSKNEEQFKSILLPQKNKDFKTILYSNFPTYYVVSEYQKKGSEELMDQMNTAFMSSKLIKYRVDSKNSPEVLSSEEKNSGISRQIILKNSIQKVLAYILLDKNNKLIIQFAEENI